MGIIDNIIANSSPEVRRRAVEKAQIALDSKPLSQEDVFVKLKGIREHAVLAHRLRNSRKGASRIDAFVFL